MYETEKEKEDRLYAESRSLKFQARELRKKRINREAELRNDKLKKQAEAKAAEDKKIRERDERIRSALLEFAASVKKYQLAFDSPSSLFSSYATTPKKEAFVLIDKVSGKSVRISTHPSGFSWD